MLSSPLEICYHLRGHNHWTRLLFLNKLLYCSYHWCHLTEAPLLSVVALDQSQQPKPGRPHWQLRMVTWQDLGKHRSGLRLAASHGDHESIRSGWSLSPRPQMRGATSEWTDIEKRGWMGLTCRTHMYSPCQHTVMPRRQFNTNYDNLDLTWCN